MNMDTDYERLINRIKQYNPKSDLKLIEKAYTISKAAHEGQQRRSGEPFITHPTEVAYILADLELDNTSIVAGLLHDVVEDTSFPIERVKEEFGEDVALLVDGVTKLAKIKYTSREELQAESLRKMFLATAKDIRVILIKLADRLHNMRTLKFKSPAKQFDKARETLEIYAPIAHRLGMSKIKWELEDLCLRYIDPKGYYDLVDKIATKRKEREAYIKTIIETIRSKADTLGIKCDIEGRPKHFYSIYKKMKEQNKILEQIYDLFAVRVIVDSVKDCYAILGMCHELFKPIPGRFKDYIAMPKPNMYQSLHNTLIGPGGQPFEVQIRTWEMHKIAEVGIAAHWKYKEGSGKDTDLDSKLSWLRQLLEWQKEMKDAREFMETLKIDLFTDEVFVFTPKGDVISLPAGSTPVDFAYAIHSEVGNKMMGAKVNGKIVPIEYELKNGDIVEILTSASVHGPSRDWLKIVKSSQARNKINQWFKREHKDENIIRGREAVEKELKKQGLSFNQLFRPEWVEPLLRKHTFNTVDDMFASIGYGAITANKIISRLKEEYKKQGGVTESNEEIIESIQSRQSDSPAVQEKKKNVGASSGIIVKGIDNCLVRLSRCCNPVPGDDVIGYITRGRGVSIHRADCINVNGQLTENSRLIEVSWATTKDSAYSAAITILSNDRTGLLLDITNAFAELKISIRTVNARTTKEKIAIINMSIEISDTEQLEKIIKKVRKIAGVFEVKRSNI